MCIMFGDVANTRTIFKHLLHSRKEYQHILSSVVNRILASKIMDSGSILGHLKAKYVKIGIRSFAA